MKKRIALLSAFVLLVSLFSFAMMPVGATGEGKAENFFFDFSTQAGFNAFTGYGNFRAKAEGSVTGADSVRTDSGLTYDAVEKAAKITKAADATEANLAVWVNVAGGTVELNTEYPVIAVKVKTTGKAVHGSGAYDKGYGRAGGHGIWSGGFTKVYADTTDWQLITFALADQNFVTEYGTNVADDNNWKGFSAVLATNLADFTDGETVAYVAWAGAFTTVAAAQDYFKATTRTDGDIPEEIAPVNKGDNFYFDFRTQAGFDTAVTNYSAGAWNQKGVKSGNENATSLTFDAQVGAMAVSIVDNAAGGKAMVYARTRAEAVDAATYPVFALKVKRVQADASLGSGEYTRTNGSGFRTAWPCPEAQTDNIGTVYSAYDEEATDWQLLTYDVGNTQYGDTGFVPASGSTSTNWNAFYLEMAYNDSELENGTVAYIQWMGVFASVEDAENWFDQTQAVEEPETGLIANGAGIREDLDYSVDAEKGRQGLRFNQKLITVVDAEGNQTIEDAEGNTLIVKDIFVLMGTAKNVNNLAAFDENSANGTTILSAQVTTCRNYTFDEATNTATYEFSALLNSVPQAQRGTDISARAYLVCKNADNEDVIVLGDVQTTNVAEMYTALGAANSFSAAVQTWMTEEI